MSGRASEIRSLEESGPVEVLRSAESSGQPVERLGDAPSARIALDRWRELRHVGSEVMIEAATDAICDWISEVIYESPVMAPPDGWIEGVPSLPVEALVNGGGWVEWGSIDELGAVELASVGSDYGYFDLALLDGWLVESGSDIGSDFTWVGTDVAEPTLMGYAEDLVISPPMWPSGSELSVSVHGLDPERFASIVAALTDGRLDGYYELLVVNGRRIPLTQLDVADD